MVKGPQGYQGVIFQKDGNDETVALESTAQLQPHQAIEDLFCLSATKAYERYMEIKARANDMESVSGDQHTPKSGNSYKMEHSSSPKQPLQPSSRQGTSPKPSKPSHPVPAYISEPSIQDDSDGSISSSDDEDDVPVRIATPLSMPMRGVPQPHVRVGVAAPGSMPQPPAAQKFAFHHFSGPQHQSQPPLKTRPVQHQQPPPQATNAITSLVKLHVNMTGLGEAKTVRKIPLSMTALKEAAVQYARSTHAAFTLTSPNSSAATLVGTNLDAQKSLRLCPLRATVRRISFDDGDSWDISCLGGLVDDLSVLLHGIPGVPTAHVDVMMVGTPAPPTVYGQAHTYPAYQTSSRPAQFRPTWPLPQVDSVV